MADENGAVTRTSPWLFIPYLSFMQGIPIIVVMQVTAIMYKSLDISNEVIGLTSLFMLPMSFKFLFGPIVDSFGTKRNWIIFSQLVLLVCFTVLAISVSLPIYFVLSLVLFSILAVASGFNEVPIDGFYIEALTPKQQAAFIGVKVAFFRISIVFTSGFMVMVAGSFGQKMDNIQWGWSLFFAIAAVLFLVSLIWHSLTLPRIPGKKVAPETGSKSYWNAFRAFFTQKHIAFMISFILLYRAGEGLLVRMAAPFLMDTADAGGLEVSVKAIGFMYGSVGVISSILGGLTGGLLLKKFEFRKTMIFLALCMTLPNILYILLAYFRPMDVTEINLGGLLGRFGFDGDLKWMINMPAQVVIAIEQFGYGLGYSAFLVYLCKISAKGNYKASFFAIATGLQTVGWTMSSAVSGYLQSYFGYTWLFIFSVIFALPGIACLIILLFRFKE